VSFTKDNLIHSVSEIAGFKKTHARKAVGTTLELIKSTLASGADVLISRFGKFCVSEKASRRGRNPQTGEDLMLDARRIVTFKPSGVLKGKLNGRG
jgi:integration host factor subunit alpha